MKYFIIYTLRIIIVYVFTYLCARVISKKAIAQMTAYEIAGIMILANVAAEPLVDKVTIKSIYGCGIIILLMIISSKLSLVNKLTPIIEHTPTIVIKNSQIDMENLKYMGLSLNQLQGLLRQQGYDDISDVDIAIIEPQGNLSVFPIGKKKNVQLEDLNIQPSSKGFTIPLIMDGKILENNIKHINKNKKWLEKELNKQGIKNYKQEVALAELDSLGKVKVFKK